MPFVHKEKKIYFFVVGAIGSLFPDIDLLIAFLNHRSITHSFWFWIIVSIAMMYVLVLFNASALKTVFLFQVAWLSHLFLDFGFTQSWFFDIANIDYLDGWFFTLSYEELSFIDTYLAIPIILIIMFYYMIVKQYEIK